MSQLKLSSEFDELNSTENRQNPRSDEATRKVFTRRSSNRNKRKRNTSTASSSNQGMERSGSVIDLTIDESSQSSCDGSSGIPTPEEVSTPEERKSPETSKLIKKTIDLVDSNEWFEDVSAPVAKKAEEEREWVIEAILNHRYDENKIKYLIKWKNWPSSTNSWEPLENMVNCNRMIEEYHEKHRVKVEALNKHFSRRQEDTGFGRGLRPERILGFSDEYADLTVLIKWKSHTKNNFVDLVSADEVYERAPHLIFDYMEEFIEEQFCEDDEDQQNRKPAPRRPNRNQKLENKDSDDKSQRLDKDIVKDPIILGCLRKDYENYFILKKKIDTSNERFLVKTTDAYKFYKKAVFIYFERNLERDWPEVPKEEE